MGFPQTPTYCFGLTKNNTITYSSTLDVGQKVRKPTVGALLVREPVLEIQGCGFFVTSDRRSRRWGVATVIGL